MSKALPRSLHRLRKRADEGDADAIFQLASMYYDGDRVPRDVKRAAEYYRKGAALGSPTSPGASAWHTSEERAFPKM